MRTIILCFLFLFVGALVFAVIYDYDLFGDDIDFHPTFPPPDYDIYDDDIYDDDTSDEYPSEEEIPEGGIITIREHPYHVSVRKLDKHVCAGSLLTPTRALTTARPFEEFPLPSQYSVLAGSSVRSGDSNALIRELDRVLRHPDYDEDFHFNKIALLYWEQPLQFGATIRAIKLPNQFNLFPYGRNGTITGWGSFIKSPAHALKAATVPLLSYSICNSIFGTTMDPDMLCAGEAAGGIGTCEGDFGAPLVVNGIQIGVSSREYGNDKPGYPGVYVQVANFGNWIRDNL